MNPKILIILLIAIVLGGAGFYISQNLMPGEEKNILTGESETPGNILVKDDFSIEVPEGWKEASAPVGVSAMVVNVDEEVTDPAAKKINFKSYFSVTYDVLQGKTQEEYPQYLKESLVDSVPGVEFAGEGALEGKNAYAIEADISQQGADFRIWLVVYKGAGDGMWIVSFNTPRSSWESYKDLFHQTAASFQVK